MNEFISLSLRSAFSLTEITQAYFSAALGKRQGFQAERSAPKIR